MVIVSRAYIGPHLSLVGIFAYDIVDVKSFKIDSIAHAQGDDLEFFYSTMWPFPTRAYGTINRSIRWELPKDKACNG